MRYPVAEHDDLVLMLALRVDNLRAPQKTEHVTQGRVIQIKDRDLTGAEILESFGVGRTSKSLFRM
ncbi:MAG: hypothetical protein GY700_15450 [Propionibacteriaceae bacterium]|nr:hypothetical protein [Propionibacteriaceae bacterium]